MIIKQTEANNTYCIDKEKQYISLVHPLLHNKNNNNQFINSKEDVKYYEEKYAYLQKNILSATQSYLHGRITPESVKYQVINLNHLVFEVTDACNLKCKYCGYGEMYEDYDERKNLWMIFSNIKPLLDYLYHIWTENKPISLAPITISFYGGEPLLNFYFIQNIVKYFKDMNLPNRAFVFGMTTNAVLLNKHINFLVENKFKLLISLDGDKDNHSYRINHSGKSSFDIVIENVDNLLNNHPAYFERYVEFNSVLHNRNSVSSIYEFIFHRYNKRPFISELSNTGIKKEMIQEFQNMYQNTVSSIQRSDNLTEIENELFMNNPFTKGLSFLLREYTSFFPKSYLYFLQKNDFVEYLPTGTCFPFSKKMFVTVNGKILPCERIGQQFGLGKVDQTGVDIDFKYIANKYNNYYDKLEKQCLMCSKASSCLQCIFNVGDIEKQKPKCHGFINKQGFIDDFANKMHYLERHPVIYQRIIKETDFE